MLSAPPRRMNGLAKNNIRQQLQTAFSCFQQSQFIESEVISRNILAQIPSQFDALHLLGIIKYQTQDYENAKIFLNQARNIQPSNVQLLNTLACTHKALGNIAASEKFFLAVLKINPLYQETLNNYLNLLEQNAKYIQIIALLEPKMSHFSKNTHFLRSLAYSYSVTGNARLALTTINQALNIQPQANNIELLNTKGAILSAQQQYQKARALFYQILNIKPSHLYAHINLAYALQKTGQLALAQEHFEKSLVLLKDANNKTAISDSATLISKIQFMLACIKLTHGDYKNGWINYVKRPSILLQAHLTPIDNMRLPNDLSGKHILIIHDQGIGDELFFLRFAPLLKSRGAHISYLSSCKIVEVIKTSPDIDNVINQENNQHYDYKFSVADLPLLLKCYSTQDIPPALSLCPDKITTKTCLKNLQQQGKGIFIGITWRAGADKIEGQDTLDILDKQIPLETLVKLLTNKLAKQLINTSINLIILQRNPKKEEIDYLKNNARFNIIDYSHCNENLLQMMSLLAVLDDYIGVSNTNMHLRGSLNKKAVVLLPYPPEWRWRLKGKSTPWYANFTLVRQSADGHWDTACTSDQQLHRPAE